MHAIYKIISKVIENKLKSMLPKLNLKKKTCHVEGT